MISQARELWALLIPAERRQAVVLLGTLILGGVLEAGAIGAVLPLIAVLSASDPTNVHPAIAWFHLLVGEPDRLEFIIIALGLVSGLFFLKSLVLGAMFWFQHSYSSSIRERLARELLRYYLERPYTFHLQKNSVSLVNNLTVESGQVAASIAQIIVLATEGVVIVGIILVLVIADPVAALLAVVMAGTVGYAFTRILKGKLHRWGVERRDNEESRRLEAQHAFGAFKELEVLGRKDYFIDRFDSRSQTTLRATRNLGFTGNLPRLWLEPMAMLGLLALAVWFLTNDRPIQSLLPTLAVFAAAGVRLMPSVGRILSAIQVINFMGPAVAAIRDDLRHIQRSSVTNERVVAGEAKPREPLRTIEFDGVSHQYSGADEVGLRNISFKIQKGDSIGIVGRTGAGKTTLVDLLLGLLQPHEGKILVNGEDIRADIRSWTSIVGYVPQHIYLIDDSILKNVALGLNRDDIDIDDVNSALATAQLLEFVESLPDGLDTVVGEAGIRLSGGERQRIGIARALYHNPDVLVFDEASSALDAETERRFVETIKQIYGTKTIFIVAHRSSAMDGVSQVFEISNGELVELEQSKRQATG